MKRCVRSVCWGGGGAEECVWCMCGGGGGIDGRSRRNSRKAGFGQTFCPQTRMGRGQGQEPCLDRRTGLVGEKGGRRLTPPRGRVLETLPGCHVFSSADADVDETGVFFCFVFSASFVVEFYCVTAKT